MLKQFYIRTFYLFVPASVTYYTHFWSPCFFHMIKINKRISKISLFVWRTYIYIFIEFIFGGDSNIITFEILTETPFCLDGFNNSLLRFQNVSIHVTLFLTRSSVFPPSHCSLNFWGVWSFPARTWLPPCSRAWRDPPCQVRRGKWRLHREWEQSRKSVN